MCYALFLRNGARESERLNGEHFPNRQRPNHQTCSAVHNRLRNTGSLKVSMTDTGRDRSVCDVDFEERVLERFEGDPNTSCRVVGRELGSL